jgi:hypothetical protein
LNLISLNPPRRLSLPPFPRFLAAKAVFVSVTVTLLCRIIVVTFLAF